MPSYALLRYQTRNQDFIKEERKKGRGGGQTEVNIIDGGLGASLAVWG